MVCQEAVTRKRWIRYSGCGLTMRSLHKALLTCVAGLPVGAGMAVMPETITDTFERGHAPAAGQIMSAGVPLRPCLQVGSAATAGTSRGTRTHAT